MNSNSKRQYFHIWLNKFTISHFISQSLKNYSSITKKRYHIAQGLNWADLISMKVNSIHSIRRAELARAAFEAVLRYGLRETTLEKVGNLAGVSKGVVLHHFKNKSLLLEAVFRRSNKLLSQSVIELYRHAQTPHERLWAIVYANFADEIFNLRVCQAWVTLISEVPHNKQCQRIQIACNTRVESNLRHALNHFLDREEARQTAFHLSFLIDGIWIRSGISLTPVNSKSAISEMDFAILKALNCNSKSIEKHRQAKQKIETIASISFGSKLYQQEALLG